MSILSPCEEVYFHELISHLHFILNKLPIHGLFLFFYWLSYSCLYKYLYVMDVKPL